MKPLQQRQEFVLICPFWIRFTYIPDVLKIWNWRRVCLNPVFEVFERFPFRHFCCYLKASWSKKCCFSHVFGMEDVDFDRKKKLIIDVNIWWWELLTLLLWWWWLVMLVSIDKCKLINSVDNWWWKWVIFILIEKWKLIAGVKNWWWQLVICIEKWKVLAGV